MFSFYSDTGAHRSPDSINLLGESQGRVRSVSKSHRYEVKVRWTGNQGAGTKTYASYRRDHEIECKGKGTLLGSADPSFRGDPGRHNPEELLVSSLSACHMLTFLHLCAINDMVVGSYEDEAFGLMEEVGLGGRFVLVVLRPKVEFEGGADEEKVTDLHREAHHLCFIANSVNFEVRCEPLVSL